MKNLMQKSKIVLGTGLVATSLLFAGTAMAKPATTAKPAAKTQTTSMMTIQAPSVKKPTSKTNAKPAKASFVIQPTSSKTSTNNAAQ